MGGCGPGGDGGAEPRQVGGISEGAGESPTPTPSPEPSILSRPGERPWFQEIQKRGPLREGSLGLPEPPPCPLQEHVCTVTLMTPQEVGPSLSTGPGPLGRAGVQGACSEHSKALGSPGGGSPTVCPWIC